LPIDLPLPCIEYSLKGKERKRDLFDFLLEEGSTFDGDVEECAKI
jgi:hypothetical protein